MSTDTTKPEEEKQKTDEEQAKQDEEEQERQAVAQNADKDEDTVYQQRCSLYRHNNSAWKERGVGWVKFLKHKETLIIRVVMRQDRTYKLILNHTVHPLSELQPNKGSERVWSWRSMDFSDDLAGSNESFLGKFKNADIAAEFKKEYDSARTHNAKMENEAKSRPATATTSPTTATTTTTTATTSANAPGTTTTTTSPGTNQPATSASTAASSKSPTS